MLQLLYKYLILHKEVSIPSIGVFHIKRKPAYLDFSNQAFIPPSHEIAFTEGAVHADKNFSSFICNEYQVNEEEALDRINSFSKAIKKNLLTNSNAEISGIGVLTKEISGALKFKPAGPLSSFLQPVYADSTISEFEEKTPIIVDSLPINTTAAEVENEELIISQKKDYWWVYAIILAAIGVAGILYYYNQNGNLR